LKSVEHVTALANWSAMMKKRSITMKLAMIDDPVPDGWHRVLLGGWYAEMGRCLWVRDD